MSERCLVQYLCKLSCIDKNTQITLPRDLPLSEMVHSIQETNYRARGEEGGRSKGAGENGGEKMVSYLSLHVDVIIEVRVSFNLLGKRDLR